MILLLAVAVLFFLSVGAFVLIWRGSERKISSSFFGGGVGVLWILFVFGRMGDSLEVTLVPWRAFPLFPTQPGVWVDELAWMVGLLLVTLTVDYLLTSDAAGEKIGWVLGFLWVGLLGVFSANALTLLLSWTLIDFLRFGFLSFYRKPGFQHDRFVLSFAFRLMGPALLVGASFLTESGAPPLSFEDFSPRVGWVLLAAAVVRYAFSLSDLSQFEDRKTIRHLALLADGMSAVISFLLLSRVAAVGLPAGVLPFLRVLLGVLLPLFGLWWILAENPLSGRASWMLGGLSFVILSVSMGEVDSSLIWGMTMILSGHLLFLGPVNMPLRPLLAALLIFGLAGWPFTPLWEGMVVFSEGGWGILWGLCHAFFLFGGVRFALWDGNTRESSANSIKTPEVLGLALVPITQFLVSVFIGLIPDSMGFWDGGWRFLLPSTAFLPVLLMQRVNLHRPDWISRVQKRVRVIPDQASKVILDMGKMATGLVMGTIRLLEGRGGLIWALLGVFFLLSLLASMGGG